MSAIRDSDLLNTLADTFSQGYSEYSLGRVLGIDRKTAGVRMRDIDSIRLKELTRLADQDEAVRVALRARFNDAHPQSETAEHAAESTIRDAGALIQGLMTDLAGDHRITPAEARKRLVDAQALQEHVAALVVALSETAKRGDRRGL